MIIFRVIWCEKTNKQTNKQNKPVKKPLNSTMRNRLFSQNSDIFHQLMLLLLSMHLFLNFRRKYVLQTPLYNEI